MMKRKTDRSRELGGAVTNWFVMMVILLFAALSVALIALGTQAYRAIGTTAEVSAERQTAVGYALSRVRSYDAAGAMRVERRALGGEETDVLIFSETIDGEAYETRMFCAEGWLREQFAYADRPLESAEDGERIAELAALRARPDGQLLELTFEHADGAQEIVHAALRSGGEGQP